MNSDIDTQQTLPVVNNQAKPRTSITRVMRTVWAEHGWPLLLYLIITLAITWPLLPNFTTKITGVDDAQHFLWMMWMSA